MQRVIATWHYFFIALIMQIRVNRLALGIFHVANKFPKFGLVENDRVHKISAPSLLKNQEWHHFTTNSNLVLQTQQNWYYLSVLFVEV